MGAEELAERPPIDVEGIALTTLSTDGRRIMLWQDGVALFADATRNPDGAESVLPDREIVPGDRLRVTGHGKESFVAPLIVPSKIEWLGSGDLPEAPTVDLIEMSSGRLSSQWVRVEGVVQAVKPFPDQKRFWLLQIATPHGRFTARLEKESDDAPTQWVDAVVAVRGVCLHIFNHRGESIGPRLHVNGASEITVLEHPPRDPFALPDTPLDNLQPFTPHEVMPHRKKVRGTVTFCRPGSHLYIQNEGRGVRIVTSDTTVFHPGDQVEAAGFVVPGAHFSEIHQAILRKVDSAPAPVPLQLETPLPELMRLPFEQTPFKDLHGRLVELGGVLELSGEDADGRWMSLVSDGVAAQVRLPPEIQEIPRRGSVVRVAGICELEYPSTELVETFTLPSGLRLLPRGPADLTVVKSASWWTPQRQWMVVAIVGILLLLALAWVHTLRRRVLEKGAELAAEMGGRRMAEARAEERTRLAEELHDTLAQGLTGVSLQLEAAGRALNLRPTESSRHLGLAGQILASHRDEVRRTLWNLRSGLLDTGDLLGSLRAIAENLCPGTKPVISCRRTGEVLDLPDSVAHAVLRIAQEAMSNAVKHASAENVEAAVEFGATEVILTVTDDGCGFKPGAAAGADPAHFGLQGMRGRARRLDGQFEVNSTPGEGTTVRATIPHHRSNGTEL
ncbi:sensor histidine kinase [Haloferula helveola]|uniref:Sensor histidine kinase n=2 Tax=Haloferula helveola TaxID=490095 RepID=A0ABM7RBQ8_9BACT|nr:sensor histidine kinase [Haloferula helveola]